MGNSICTALRKPVFSCTAGVIANTSLLENNVDWLIEAAADIMIKKEKIEREIKVMTGNPVQDVEDWMYRVQGMEEDLSILLEDYEESRPSGCLKSCCSSTAFDLSRRAIKMLREVEEVKKANPDGNFVKEVQIEPVVRVEHIDYATLNRKQMLDELHHVLEDPGVWMVGIVGMGGVGKTALLQVLNNDFLETNLFDVVIWVNSPDRQATERVQDAILTRLQRSVSPRNVSGWRKRQATTVRDCLMHKKFLLLVDDLWEKLDLVEVGIPLCAVVKGQGYNSKVVFTTRDRSVCRRMCADRIINVVPLDSKESWELFEMKIKHSMINVEEPSIDNFKRFASPLVTKCRGLPLAISAVAESLANKMKTWGDSLRATLNLESTRMEQDPRELTVPLTAFDPPSDESHAVATEEIEECQFVPASSSSAPRPSKCGFSDAEFADTFKVFVFPVLLSSFQRLKEKRHKLCLLYCCLYPEDYSIDREDLVEKWLGQGFLELVEMDQIYQTREQMDDDVDMLRLQGRQIIRDLIDTSLLDSEDHYHVKMHPMIREMALRIISSENVDSIDYFWVHINKGGQASLPVVDASDGISPIQSNVEFHVDVFSSSDNLNRQLLSGSSIIGKSLPLLSSPSLRVLDLSNSDIKELPESVSSLFSLRYLNLSGTSIKSLPKQVGELKLLKTIKLHNTSSLLKIPREAICNLSCLSKLDLFRSGYIWNSDFGLPDPDRNLGLADLQTLTQLQHLGITGNTTSDFEVCNEVLYASITRLHLNAILPDINAQDLFDIVYKMEKLEILHIEKMQQLKGQLMAIQGHKFESYPFKFTVRRVTVAFCDKLKNIGALCLAPFLESLDLNNCSEITSVVFSKEDEYVHFPALIELQLKSLPVLASLSSHPLSWPSLKELLVVDCSNLTNLMFGRESALEMKVIKGKWDWWENLSWEETVKSRFDVYFRESHDINHHQETHKYKHKFKNEQEELDSDPSLKLSNEIMEKKESATTSTTAIPALRTVMRPSRTPVHVRKGSRKT